MIVWTGVFTSRVWASAMKFVVAVDEVELASARSDYANYPAAESLLFAGLIPKGSSCCWGGSAVAWVGRPFRWAGFQIAFQNRFHAPVNAG